MIGSLDFKAVAERPEIVSPTVLEAATPETGIQSAEIDPQYMGGHELSEQYGVDPDGGGNCVIVRGKRGEVKTTAAIIVPVGYRADLNGIVVRETRCKKSINGSFGRSTYGDRNGIRQHYTCWPPKYIQNID